MSFYFSSFKFQLSSSEILPLFGSTLRGGFGYTFKKLTCLRKSSTCKDCVLRHVCPYSYIFETPSPENSTIMRKTEYIPHPYVIDVEEGKTYFNLILVGKAVNYLPYFIVTFDSLGEKGLGRKRIKYKLKEVKDIDNKTIFSKEKNFISPEYTTLKWEEFIPQGKIKKVEIEIKTPLRIIKRGKVIYSLTPEVIIESLARRVSLLSYFHCNFNLWDEVKPLIEKSKNLKFANKGIKWYDMQRYSTRQKRKIGMGGVIGKIQMEGDFTPFIQLLKAGEFLHTGKGTTFGLGKYKLKILE